MRSARAKIKKYDRVAEQKHREAFHFVSMLYIPTH